MEYLFIGGWLDGQYQNVNTELNQVRYQKYPEDIYHFFTADIFNIKLEIETQTYLKQKFGDSDQTIYYVFVLEELSHTPLKAMLDGYAKNKS
jgi:hypothetical protein